MFTTTGVATVAFLVTKLTVGAWVVVLVVRIEEATAVTVAGPRR